MSTSISRDPRLTRWSGSRTFMLITESLMSPFTVTLTLKEVSFLRRARFLISQPMNGMDSSMPTSENLFL